MTLLITILAAIASTIVWYANDKRDTYMLGTLSLIFWGASLMWFVDFIAEYAELKADYFVQSFSDILNDSLLGLAVVALGLIVWLIILLIKDPKGVLKEKFKKSIK